MIVARSMRVIGAAGILAGALSALSEGHAPAVAAAAVEIAPTAVGASDPAILRELTHAFDRAEAAVHGADLDALMRFYAGAYNYHGLKRSDVRRVWQEVFSHYRAVSSRHVFTDLKVERAGNIKKIFVTCTGGIYGTDMHTGKPITIDSWVGEVHHLVFEQGEWRFLGNAGKAPESNAVGSAPHHPLF